MTIKSVADRTHTPPAVNTAQKNELSRGKAASVRGSDDSVAITATAQDIKRASESSSPDAIVDADKVAAVKKSLADGSYQVNAVRVAEKMIQYEKLMP